MISHTFLTCAGENAAQGQQDIDARTGYAAGHHVTSCDNQLVGKPSGRIPRQATTMNSRSRQRKQEADSCEATAIANAQDGTATTTRRLMGTKCVTVKRVETRRCVLRTRPMYIRSRLTFSDSPQIRRPKLLEFAHSPEIKPGKRKKEWLPCSSLVVLFLCLVPSGRVFRWFLWKQG